MSPVFLVKNHRQQQRIDAVDDRRIMVRELDFIDDPSKGIHYSGSDFFEAAVSNITADTHKI